MTLRLGVVLPVPGLGLAESIELACTAEQLGFDDVWTSEVAGHDGLTPLAALASRTARVRLGVAVVPAATRPVALLAMTAATLHELSGGRFILGLGASTFTIVERWMGLSAGASTLPATRMRETIEAIRLALSGEKVSYDGTTLRMLGFRLSLAPVDVPIMVGALGPRMFRLAGEVGDGVIATFAAAERFEEILRDAHAGSVAAGRTTRPLEVVCRIPVAFGENDPALRIALRWFIAEYAGIREYNAFMVRQGFASEAAQISRAWSAGHRSEAAAGVSDRLLDSLVTLGPVQHCLDRLEAYGKAGATTLLISPVTAAGDEAGRLEAVLGGLEAIAHWRRARIEREQVAARTRESL